MTVSPTSVLEDATGAAGTLVYTISLDHASAFATTVNYTLTGTATEGSDYPTITTHSVTIAAGQTSATVSIDPTTDAVFEGNETIILALTGGTSGPGTVAVAAARLGHRHDHRRRCDYRLE